MINIAPPDINDIDLLDRVIDSKYSIKKELLNNIKSMIIDRYNSYEENRKELNAIRPNSMIEIAEKKALESCYEYGNESTKAKNIILNSLPNSLKSKCPYCMISVPTTLDHYLDKSTFPEFSIYTKNLIPCCFDCNLYKGTTFLDNNGIRIIINSYYDDILAYNYLKIELDFDDNDDVPYLKNIKLEFTSDSADNEIVRNHFEQLKLKDRYLNLIPDFLVEKTEILRKLVQNGFCIDIVKTMINLEIESFAELNGPNYWKVSLLNEIKNNDEILEFITRESS